MVRLAQASHRRCFLDRQVLGALLFWHMEQLLVEMVVTCCFLMDLIVLVEVEYCLVLSDCCLDCLGFLVG